MKSVWLIVVHVLYPLALCAFEWQMTQLIVTKSLDKMKSPPTLAPDPPQKRPRSGGIAALYAGNARSVVSRGFLATKGTNWLIMVSGFFEPIFSLLSLGIGLGSLVDSVATTGGLHVPYAAVIAAVSAMNCAIFDSTSSVFFKMQYAKLSEGVLATLFWPLNVALGEIFLALVWGSFTLSAF